MNYFLILVILGLGGAGYYEYTVLEQTSVEDQHQLTDLGGKIEALKTENAKHEDDIARLTKNLAEVQAKMTDLSTQIQTAQSALTESKQQAFQTPKTDMAAETSMPPTPPNNNLGMITTLDGKTFQNCQLLKVEADGIVINHSEGITKISYGLLTPDMQKKFGYDPHQTAALTEAQIQYQEEQRKAADRAAGK